jgi:NADPH:quinone reductase-like Zn-dependent oxidoreductase
MVRSTGDVPPGYEAVGLVWAFGDTVKDAVDGLDKYVTSDGAEGICGIRLVPEMMLHIYTEMRPFHGAAAADVRGHSSTRWTAYGTQVRRTAAVTDDR